MVTVTQDMLVYFSQKVSEIICILEDAHHRVSKRVCKNLEAKELEDNYFRGIIAAV